GGGEGEGRRPDTAGNREAEAAEHALDFVRLNVQPGEPRYLRRWKIDDPRGHFRHTRDKNLRGLATAELEHHRRRKLKPRQHEGGVDSALEPVPGTRFA